MYCFLWTNYHKYVSSIKINISNAISSWISRELFVEQVNYLKVHREKEMSEQPSKFLKTFFLGFTMLCWFLLYSAVNQLFMHMYLLFQTLFPCRPYSAVNQLFTHMYLLCFRLFSHVGRYKVLCRAPCALLQVLIRCLLYMQQCVCVSPSLPVYVSPPYPLVTISLFLHL